MRTLAVAAITGLIALAMAGVASAAPSVSLVWTATTGSGTTGGSAIDAAVGDTLTLDILVTTGGSIVSFGVTSAGLAVDISGAGVVDMTDLGGGVNDRDAGVVTNYTLATGLPPASATYTGGGLTYISGSAVTCPFPALGNTFAPGFCGTVTGFIQANAAFPPVDQGGGVIGSFITTSLGPVTGTFTLGTAQFEVVPEPATGGLLALGLGALAFIGRRRA
jgi:hypothetical protein